MDNEKHNGYHNYSTFLLGCLMDNSQEKQNEFLSFMNKLKKNGKKYGHNELKDYLMDYYWVDEYQIIWFENTAFDMSSMENIDWFELACMWMDKLETAKKEGWFNETE